MRVDIKEVKKCRNGAAGNFILYRAGHARITVSQKLNTVISEYAATVLHELLHLWVTILRLKGFRVTNIKEHRFIYAAEKVIITMAKKHLRRNK